MNLYLLSQTVNHDYDTYDATVVAAESEEEARLILPRSYYIWDDDNHTVTWAARPDQVTVELLGKAKAGTKAGVILASFNAG